MIARAPIQQRRVAIYCRKSVTEGLQQEFNSLDAQREACEAYVRSQQGEGWVALDTRYDDGGFSGATTERPAFLAAARRRGARTDRRHRRLQDRPPQSLASRLRQADRPLSSGTR
jgi:DNA invertase Pin-like site-specific DNA recombinase